MSMQDTAEAILSDYVGQGFTFEEVGSTQELGFYAVVEVGDSQEQAEVTGLEHQVDGPWLEPGYYGYHESILGVCATALFKDYAEAASWWAKGPEALYQDFYSDEMGDA